MIREIRKKLLILNNRKPFTAIADNCFGEMERKNWIITNMLLEGSALSRSQIDALASGNCILEASIGDHVMAERLDTIFDVMRELTGRRRPLDLHVIRLLRNIYEGEDEGDIPEYRRRNLMMPEIDYMAKLPAEIPSAMEELGVYLKSRISLQEGSREVFESAVKIHNSIIEIMPYGENDKVVARVAMLYFLMLNGYPPVLPELKETDYNELIFRYLKTGSPWTFEEALMEGILAHLELMIQLTAY